MQQLALKYADSLKVRFERDALSAEVFETALESLARMFSVLELKIAKLTEQNRVKIVWEEKSLLGSLDLIRGQMIGINTLVSIMQT